MHCLCRTSRIWRHVHHHKFNPKRFFVFFLSLWLIMQYVRSQFIVCTSMKETHSLIDLYANLLPLNPSVQSLFRHDTKLSSVSQKQTRFHSHLLMLTHAQHFSFFFFIQSNTRYLVSWPPNSPNEMILIATFSPVKYLQIFRLQFQQIQH